MCRHVVAIAALSLVTLLVSVTSEAQSPAVLRVGDGEVTVRADGTPLGELLRALAAFTPMELKIDPAVGGRPVTIVLERVTVERAIRSVVLESGVDFVMTGLERFDDAVPIRVIAGDARKAVVVSANAEGVSARSEKKADPEPGPTPAAPDEAERQAAKEQEAAQQAAEMAMPAGPPPPGSMTNQQWMQALFPAGGVRPARSGEVMLPFVGDDGLPLIEHVAPASGRVMLPFTDEFDQPMIVPVQPRPDGMIMLPFPAGPNVPLLVPGPASSGSTSTPVPGIAPRSLR